MAAIRARKHYWGIGLAMLAVVVWFAAAPNGLRAQSHHGDDGESMMQKHPENWAPFSKLHLYLCAFHISKENPSFQVQAHHYCSPQGKKLHQCVIFDSRDPEPKLIGIEYIIDNEQYKALSDAEKKYWHPHAYEILSGQLVAPDLADQGDSMFPGLITSWGKTWHTWRDPSEELPLGEPMLMWSSGGDGQINAKLIEERDSKFNISTSAIRDRRKSMGFGIPSVPPPKSINDLGRQWTASGPDEPKK